MATYNDTTTPLAHDDRVVDHHTTNWSDGLARTLSSLALVIALAALVVGWVAYSRTGEDLEDRIQESVSEASRQTVDTTQDAADAIDAGPDGVDEDDTDVQQQP